MEQKLVSGTSSKYGARFHNLSLLTLLWISVTSEAEIQWMMVSPVAPLILGADTYWQVRKQIIYLKRILRENSPNYFSFDSLSRFSLLSHEVAQAVYMLERYPYSTSECSSHENTRLYVFVQLNMPLHTLPLENSSSLPKTGLYCQLSDFTTWGGVAEYLKLSH